MKKLALFVAVMAFAVSMSAQRKVADWGAPVTVGTAWVIKINDNHYLHLRFPSSSSALRDVSEWDAKVTLNPSEARALIADLGEVLKLVEDDKDAFKLVYLPDEEYLGVGYEYAIMKAEGMKGAMPTRFVRKLHKWLSENEQYFN